MGATTKNRKTSAPVSPAADTRTSSPVRAAARSVTKRAPAAATAPSAKVTLTSHRGSRRGSVRRTSSAKHRSGSMAPSTQRSVTIGDLEVDAQMCGEYGAEPYARAGEAVELLLLRREHRDVGLGDPRRQRSGWALEEQELGVRVDAQRHEVRQVDVEPDHGAHVDPVDAHIRGRAALGE